MRRREVKFNDTEWAAMEAVAGNGVGDVAGWVKATLAQAVRIQRPIANLRADVEQLKQQRTGKDGGE